MPLGELPEDVRQNMVFYCGVSKWYSIIYVFIGQIDMTSGPKMLGKIGVQIKSCRNGSLYIYILKAKTVRLSQAMRLLIGVIRWGRR